MSLQETWQQLQVLPPELQREAADFIAFLSEKSSKKPSGSAPNRPGSFTEGSFFGIWRDRPEMEDAAKWVRQLREREWQGH